MTDYSTGKIYKMWVEGAEECCYIGSTIQTLNDRFSHHQASARSNSQYKFASAPFFEEGNNVLITLLEDYSCNSKQELLAKEAEWLLKFPDAMNKSTPILDSEERHKRAKALCLKNYYEDRENRIAKNKQWKEEHKEEIATQRASPAFRAKENEAHNARMANPEYAKAHKEKQSAIKKAKVECPVCKKVMNRNSLWEHNKKVHIPPLPT